MKVGVLTAALQELTRREIRDADPDRAVEDWAGFARDLGVDTIQLSAALHPTEADVPPEAMLDPVANTLDLRQPFDRSRARRVERALASAGVSVSDIGYFDNMLHDDPAIRRGKHAFMQRVFDAAGELGVHAVCGFVGRNQRLSTDENLRDFEDHFVPLLEIARSRGLTYRVEQCPMPGWDPGDHFHNNIAYTPGAWIALHRICEKHGVGDVFRIHYDPSHAILMGLDSRSIFQYLRDELAARELLQLDIAATHLVVEHEYPRARIQDRERLTPILQGSIAFVRSVDQAAAAMYALQHEVLAAQDIPIQGCGREAYRS